MLKLALAFILLQAALVGEGPIDRARRAQARGDLAAAQAHLEQALLDYPHLSDAIRLRQAQLYLQADSVARAEGLWREVVGRGPAGAPSRAQALAYNNLGLAAYRRGQARQALALLRLALVADADYELARRNYELILRQLPPNPPPPPTPPPPPPPQRPLPKETAGAQAQMPELSRAEALRAIEQIEQRPRKYLQQNRKTVVGRRPNGPPW